MESQQEKSFAILGHVITPGVVREIMAKASKANWGAHLLRWRYFDVAHEGITYHKDALVLDPSSEIYVYGYYRTDPPRLQWGFFNPTTGIAVIYDSEANLIATVFKPVEGALFFERQLSPAKIDRKEWQV